MTLPESLRGETTTPRALAEATGLSVRHTQRILRALDQQSEGRLLRPAGAQRLEVDLDVLRSLLSATEDDPEPSVVEVLARLETLEGKVEALLTELRQTASQNAPHM